MSDEAEDYINALMGAYGGSVSARSSVPEAARAAEAERAEKERAAARWALMTALGTLDEPSLDLDDATKAGRRAAAERWNSSGFSIDAIADAVIHAAAPHIVAAAVAEERATTGRALEALAAKIEAERFMTLGGEFSKGANQAYDLAASIIRRAALASPGEGE